MGHPFRVLFHVLVCLARAVGAMHQAGPGSDNYVCLLPKKRFMAQAADLFLTNELSAVKFSSLVENARLAGAQTGRIKQGSKKNLARDLRSSKSYHAYTKHFIRFIMKCKICTLYNQRTPSF